jgi:hypothetical protein
MRPYLITAKLMWPSNMKRFPSPVLAPTLKNTSTVLSRAQEMSTPLNTWEKQQVNPESNC